MTEQPSLNIEALARLDLRPDEILAVTFGAPDLTVHQCAEVQEWLTDWLTDHGQPVAGVLVLPQGTQLAAIRAPEGAATIKVELHQHSLNDADLDRAVARIERHARLTGPTRGQR